MALSALIVEDEQDFLDVLATELRSAGFAVTTATTGDEARKLIGKQRFNLLMIDYRIDGPDGLELLEAARSESQNQDSTIWIMTGAADAKFVSRMLEASVDLFLQKPMDLDELRRCLLDAFPQIESGAL